MRASENQTAGEVEHQRTCVLGILCESCPGAADAALQRDPRNRPEIPANRGAHACVLDVADEAAGHMEIDVESTTLTVLERLDGEAAREIRAEPEGQGDAGEVPLHAAAEDAGHAPETA